MAIVAACAGQIGSYHVACLKGIEAGSRQVGVYQSIQGTQAAIQNKAQEAALSISPEIVKTIVPIVALGVRANRGDTIGWTLGNQLSLFDSVTLEGSKNGTGKVTLTWNLR